MTTPADAFKHAAARAIAITDPGERAAAIGEILALAPGVSAELRAARQAAVIEMRTRHHLSYGDIAKALGISRARVQQIAEGRSQGKRKDAEGGPTGVPSSS